MTRLQSARQADLHQLKMSAPGLIPEKFWNKQNSIISSMRILPGPDYKIKPVGLVGYTLDILFPPSAKSSWPWNVKNTTTGATGQVQVNGDDFLAALNGFTSNAGGNPTNASPYPQIAVTGNGYIYAKATPTTAGTASPLTSLDITFQASSQAQDTASPATFYWMLLATITNWNPDGAGSGKPTFTVANQYGPMYGPSTLFYCAGVLGVY